MTARQITPPFALPVSLDAAIVAARADGAGMDAEIELDVRAIAGEVQHAIQRALIEQTWRVTLDAFPAAVKLTMPPLIAVEHVKFYDADGILQTLDPQDYITDSVSEPGYVMPAPGRSWPATAARINAVEVQYRCGYGANYTAVPAEIQSYILGRITEKHAPGESRAAAHLGGLLDGMVVF
jgi:uncharacterized phiE125 gp8 family phage protein